MNTFYYVPLVYEEPAGSGSNHSWHELLRSSSWLFFESLFRHHLALLLPFNLAILVPVRAFFVLCPTVLPVLNFQRCKLGFISSLVLLSNLVMFGCFASAICQLMISTSHAHSLRLFTILCLGPMCQMLLVLRLLVRMWVSRSHRRDHLIWLNVSFASNCLCSSSSVGGLLFEARNFVHQPS